MVADNEMRTLFKEYLFKRVANKTLTEIDAQTQYSDADYIRKHEDDLKITSYYSIFISNERFEQALLNLKKHFQNQGKSDSTFYAYKRALNSYKMFFEAHIEDQLKIYLAKYFTHKSSQNYDEQYKYDYFAKNSNIFNDLNNLPEKLVQLGSPNFVPYVWKSSMFRYLAFKHTLKLSQILEDLFNETLPINTRIEAFRKDIKEILLGDSEWNNKDMIDPSVESASFFLSLKYPNKYLLFTRIKPYTNFSKDFNLGLEKFNHEDRYIAWIDYCKNNLIPLLNNYGNSNYGLLDCQDFIWFAFNKNKGDNMSLKEKFIKYVYDVVYKSNQSYSQYGKKIENLDNIILNLTNTQIYDIQTSEEISQFLFQLKKKNGWQEYNHKNGNGIPYAILNTHYRKFIQNNIEEDNLMKQEKIFTHEKICQPLNQILYGPPGTGKTYNTVLKAMSIIDDVEYKGVSSEQYSELKNRFDELKQAGQIEFVTFHQSYSYEEFVEGIKPNLDSENLSYQLENGIFKQICNKAIKRETTNFDEVYNQFLDEVIEYENENSEPFTLKTSKNKTFGIEVNPNKNLRLLMGKDLKPWGTLTKTNLENIADWKYYAQPIYEYLKKKYNLNTQKADNTRPYILIIDEINRGDVSKIFGELITLIEEDKRIGNKYQMKTTLPYSKELFGVPNNLYIIGTMNTADRSIALLDTALRRRFDFEEIMPRPELLAGKVVAGINLEQLLKRINERITDKYDRDHQIGHSYLIDVALENDTDEISKNKLERAYKNRILPLLNEYFYNDTKTVSQILNCSENELQNNFLDVLNKAQNS